MMIDGTSGTDQSSDESAARPFNPDGGEDEGSASQDGDDSHLRDDQKPLDHTGNAGAGVDDDDPRKTEKLTKAGRDIDPDAGSD